MAKSVSPQEAAAWLAAGEAILIDVREADEFRDEHIAYANSLPLSNLNALFEQMNIPDNRKVIFQCLKGVRGGKACDIVISCNKCSNEIFNMDGGIIAWKEAGLPVAGNNDNKPKLSIFRQVQIIVGGLVTLMVVLGLMGLTFGFILAGLLGTALCVAGITGWCGLAMLLQKMPWNK